MPRLPRIRSRHLTPLALAGLLGAAGTLHFRAPKYYDALIPEALPFGPRPWTYLSGAAELACAAAVAVPATRRAGGLAAAGLFAAVFPGNLKMARDWRGRGVVARGVAYGRLPLQAPLIAWALKVSRDAR
ncbi:hypothetical protein RM780_08165 [Streptomyces sp. DSM 44917]|uniref:DoxX family protein n=1 Tax=Streptomyces boetiae TaxID=3075541 RepID=A0ABU2L6E9_9ACTN|nr:hypothetical protein [Streptomyces sp. DSM 44917]MDT0306937.1 hypothetical protein [Streptomyces sp. DSM 44917]